MKKNSSNTREACLNICVALPAEAKWLVKRYRLDFVAGDKRISLYRRGPIRLIVSGVGALNMAAAIGFLQAHNIDSHHTFLNIGIAGGTLGELGKAYLCDRLLNFEGKTSFYPSVFKPKLLPFLPVCSVDLDHKGYRDDAIIDNEAHAFFACATAHVVQEQVAIVKIISDNDNTSYQSISASSIIHWFEHNSAAIVAVINFLLEKTEKELSLLPDLELGEFCQKWHFTYSQKNQLREYLRRAQVHHLMLQPEMFLAFSKSSDVLEAINQALLRHSYRW